MTNWTGDPDELLTLDEAAKLIPRADADTLKRLIRSGKLRAYRPGKKYLTTRADVRAAIIACRVPSPARPLGK
jgi:excisionase family DNA binding protein